MLPMLCQGSGCNASSVAPLQWTLLGAVTTSPTQPLSLAPLERSFPALVDSASGAAQGDLDAPHVNVYLVGARERDDGSVGACDPSGMLCGHRWLGNATRSSFEADSVQSFHSSNLKSDGLLLEASESQNSGNVLAADSLVLDFDAEATGAKASGWRIALGCVATAVLFAAAAAAGLYAWKAFIRDQPSPRLTGGGASVSSDGQQMNKVDASKLGAPVDTPTPSTGVTSPWARARCAMQVLSLIHI